MENQLRTADPERNAVLLGDAGGGKTALVSALSGRNFNSSIPFTHGARTSPLSSEFSGSLIDVGGDTQRSEIVREINRLKPLVALFVMDSRRWELVSFHSWYETLTECDGSENITKLLVVTQCDLREPRLDVAQLKYDYGITEIYETSAKTNQGIQELRTAVRNNLSTEDDNEVEFGEVAMVVRLMAEQLCSLVAKNPNTLREIEWRDLERLLSFALQEIGFSIELTPPAKDGGKDIIAYCIVAKESRTYYIEVKHWRSAANPGDCHVADFVAVNAANETDGGLFLSSSGFTKSVYGRISELCKQRVRLGEQDKIVSLCQNYVRKRDGLWRSQTPLPELLFEHTLG